VMVVLGDYHPLMFVFLVVMGIGAHFCFVVARTGSAPAYLRWIDEGPDKRP
jgi:hypothetical protein